MATTPFNKQAAMAAAQREAGAYPTTGKSEANLPTPKKKKAKVPNENQNNEIKSWNQRLRDPNLDPYARARIERRIKFLGGQVLTPEQAKAQGISDLLGSGATAANDVANQFFGDGSLGRVDENRDAETQGALDREKALADQYGQRSGEVQDTIDRNKAMLAGYDAPEMQAIREAAQRGIDTQYQTQNRQLALNQARSGVRGASAAAQANNLDRQRLETQGNLEQDLFVKNADEKRRALNDYTNLIGNTTQAEYNRASTSAGSYADRVAAARADELRRRQYNLGNQAAENAGRYGTYFGSIGLGEARQGNINAQRNANRLIQIAQQNADTARDAAA